MGETAKARKFMRLFEAHDNYLRRYIYSRVRDAEDTQDIYQQCLYNAFEAFDQIRDEKSFQSWITVIALNVIRKTFQKRKFTETSFEAVYELNPNQAVFRDENIDVEGEILRNQEKKDARKFISQLSYRERVLIYYYYDEGKTIEEIAGILGEKVGTLYSLHSRIKAKFRRKEGDYGTGRRKKNDKENS